MDIITQIQTRRAYRAYDSQRPVSKDILVSLVEAAHLAPSYANRQGWRWILVDQEPQLSALRNTLAEGNYWAKKAPALAALVSGPAYTPTVPGGRDYAAFGAGLSSMNFMLQAEALNLVAHPMAGFDPEAAKAALGIPEEHVVMILFSVGYQGDPSDLKDHHRASETAARVRQPLESVYAWNAWDPKLEPKKA